MSISAIGKWRKERREFIELGYFEQSNHVVAKNESTGYPILRQCRLAQQELENIRLGHIDRNTEGQLTEKDKETLALILKKAQREEQPDKLIMFVAEFWGKDPKYVDYDLNSDDITTQDFDF